MACMAKESAIGDLLVRAGVIDSSGLSRALEVQKKEGISLGKALVALGLANEQGIAAAIAKSMQIEFLGAELPEVPAEVASLLPSDFCRKRMVVPLSLQRKTLRLALADPMDYSTTQDVEFRTGKRVVAVVASQSQIQSLIHDIYPEEAPANLEALGTAGVQGEVETVGDSEFEVVDPAKLAKDTQIPPVIRSTNFIFTGAAKNGASTIPIDPKDNFLQVRYRVDGV